MKSGLTMVASVAVVVLATLLSGSAWAHSPGEFYLFQTSLALDANRVPYVAYMDRDDGQGSIMKFEGRAWIPMMEPVSMREPVPGVPKNIWLFPSLTLDAAGMPYVVRMEFNGFSVVKFEKGRWTFVGGSIPYSGWATPASLALDAKGIPYVAFAQRDQGNRFKLLVLKLEGDKWVSVGEPVFSQGMIPSLALDAAGVPYVAYLGMDKGISVMKFERGNWISVGKPSPTPGLFPALALNRAGVPYVAYMNGEYRLSVMKFEKGNWVSVGKPGFSSGWFPTLALDAGGVPYVVYREKESLEMRDLKIFANGVIKLSVMKFENGNWVSGGLPGFPSVGKE
jgi:hypothetical protein